METCDGSIVMLGGCWKIEAGDCSMMATLQQALDPAGAAPLMFSVSSNPISDWSVASVLYMICMWCSLASVASIVQAARLWDADASSVLALRA